jgi:hypothetical protein
MKLEFSWQIFEKHSTIKFHENPSSGIWVDARPQTYRWTDMTELTVNFHNFADAPKNVPKITTNYSLVAWNHLMTTSTMSNTHTAFTWSGQCYLSNHYTQPPLKDSIKSVHQLANEFTTTFLLHRWSLTQDFKLAVNIITVIEEVF